MSWTQRLLLDAAAMAMAAASVVAAPAFVDYKHFSSSRKRLKFFVKFPSKIKFLKNNSQTKLVAGSNFGWKIRANQSSSVSSNTEKIVELSQDMDDSLATTEVFDLNGNAVLLTELWKDRKVVIGFARHFGCVLCRKRADILASQKDKMDVAGVALVLIGPGSVDQARAFANQTKFPGEVYADPNHSTFDALKFVSGVLTTFTPSAGMRIIESYLEGYKQDWGLSFQKDTVNKGGWQQGGILVAGPGKKNIIYLHKDKEAGDDPNIEDVIKACCVS